MSMMWMRMPGQSWFASSLGFLLMWVAMMVPMMIPSALPMFLKTRQQQLASLCYMACGYFAVWLVAGLGIYAIGMALATVAMQSESFSRSVPFLSGSLLVSAGVIQFTRWKMTRLLRCRSTFGCAISSPEQETGFRLGCKQGAACCLCCLSPMIVLLALGIMNLLVMIAIAVIIAAEKLFPRPELTARLVGIATICAGVITIAAS
jgi:predicted metal-binding membrane protein